MQQRKIFRAIKKPPLGGAEEHKEKNKPRYSRKPCKHFLYVYNNIITQNAKGAK